jgi:hypothetical protein
LFQDILSCEKFRKQGLQNVEELEICYGSITNIGIYHWSPHMTSASTNIQPWLCQLVLMLHKKKETIYQQATKGDVHDHA